MRGTTLIEFRQDREFDFLSVEYRDLFARSSATAFQHPLWLDRLFARLVPKSGRQSAILTGRTKEGRLVFLLPLLKRWYGPVPAVECADMGVNDYNMPVIDRDFQALISHPSVQRDLRAAVWPSIVWRMQKTRDDVGRSGFFVSSRRTFMGFHAHEVPLRFPFSEWRKAALEDSFARFLDKKRKALEKKGALSFRELVDADEISEAFSSLRRFRRMRWPNDLLERKPYFDFYLDVAVRGQQLGSARTFVLSCKEETLGVEFGLADRGQFIFLLMGFNIDEYRNYSVGLLLLESSIRDSIARGDTVFDFSIGDESYKGQFGTRSTPMFTDWLGPPLVSVSANLAFGWLVQLRSLKSQLSNTLTRLMRAAMAIACTPWPVW